MNLDGKKVFVTGGDGFIGSHLVEALVKKGANVKALSYYNSFNFHGWLEDTEIYNDIEVVSGDVRDPHFCKTTVKGCDVVFNLAALIGIPYSYLAPDSYIDTNVKGALNICQAALEADKPRVIQISTSEVYGTAKYVPINEEHPIQPQSPYSASKIGADNIAMSFWHSFELPVTIARPFNTYGPRQSARAVIPTIITQIAGGMKQMKLGDISPTRDMNFVEDTCKGMIVISESDNSSGETINIGSNFEISIADILDKIKNLMGSDVEYIQDPGRIRPKGSEVQRLWCDNTKINRLAGFSPDYNIDQGLEKTIEWFTKPENLNKYKPGIYNV